MNTFIHKNGKVADRQLDPYMQQTKQKKNTHMQHCWFKRIKT